MTLPTFPVTTLDSVFTRMSFYVIGGPEFKDSKYQDRPLLKMLDERALMGKGSPNIMHPVNLGTAFRGHSLGRNQNFTITGDANETWSQWKYALIQEPCFISWWDIDEADGNEHKMLSLVQSRIRETRENLEDNILTQLAQTTKANANDLTTLLEIVATTGAIGGLNPATAGQETWAAETEATINWSVEGVGRTRELSKKITDNKGKPDMVLLPVQFFNETLEIGDSMNVINQDARTRGGTRYADLGLRVPFIVGMPVISDPKWDEYQPNTGLVLDLNDIHMVTRSKWNYYMYPFKEMAHHGVLGQASVMLKRTQLTTSRRRTQGSLTSIS